MGDRPDPVIKLICSFGLIALILSMTSILSKKERAPAVNVVSPSPSQKEDERRDEVIESPLPQGPHSGTDYREQPVQRYQPPPAREDASRPRRYERRQSGESSPPVYGPPAGNERSWTPPRGRPHDRDHASILASISGKWISVSGVEFTFRDFRQVQDSLRVTIEARGLDKMNLPVRMG